MRSSFFCAMFKSVVKESSTSAPKMEGVFSIRKRTSAATWTPATEKQCRDKNTSVHKKSIISVTTQKLTSLVYCKCRDLSLPAHCQGDVWKVTFTFMFELFPHIYTFEVH